MVQGTSKYLFLVVVCSELDILLFPQTRHLCIYGASYYYYYYFFFIYNLCFYFGEENLGLSKRSLALIVYLGKLFAKARLDKKIKNYLQDNWTRTCLTHITSAVF